MRSACPNSLSERDGEILRGLGVTDVIDLRGGGNADEVMRGYEALPFIDVHRIPIGDESVPKTASEVPYGYLRMAEHCNIPQVFRILADSRGGVIFHCFAGKDRTGVVAAMLLMLAGVADEDIIADYTLTYAYFIKRLRADFLAATPNLTCSSRCPTIWKALSVFSAKSTAMFAVICCKRRNGRTIAKHT